MTGTLLSSVALALILLSQKAASVPVESQSCLTEFAELINSDKLIPFLDRLVANLMSEIGPVPDDKFELAVPELLKLSGSYSGVKLQLTPPKFETIRFDAAAFTLSVKLSLDAQRIEGTKYEIEGTVKENRISGSGGPFHLALKSSSLSAQVFFEGEGFDCALGNYKIRDLKYDYTLGDVDINLPGLTVNGKEVKNKDEVKLKIKALQDLLQKSQDLTKYKDMLNGLLTQVPISPDLLRTMIP